MEKAKYKENVDVEYFEDKLKTDKIYKKFYEEKIKGLPLSLDDKYKLMIEKGHFISDYKDTEDLLSDYKLTDRTTYLFGESLLNKKTKNLFLLTCGGFSPVHEGHVNMMKVAKDCLEKNGHNVIGGYISPSHDIYVDSKRNGEARLNMYKRIDLLEKRLNKEEYFYVDKWESTICRKEVNYTVVIERLQSYLQGFYRGYDIEVVFVYGSDNRAFGEVLEVSERLNVCVNRSEENKLEKTLKYQYVVNEDILVESSKSIRDRGKFEEDNYLMTGVYEIREDSKESMDYLSEFIKDEKLNEAKEKIIDLIRSCISENLEVRELNVDSQLKKLDELLTKEKYGDVGVINLDVYANRGIYKGVSRIFKLCEGQILANGMIGRDGSTDLLKYFSGIPKGRYVILDDDKASGYTYETIKSILGDEIVLEGFIGLNDLVRDENVDSFDVVDIRDFIVGSKEGGLCVEINEGVYCRVPYIEPYVNVMKRASILPEKVKLFTEEIWKINYGLFKNSGVRLMDLPEKNQLLFLEEGYKSETTLENILLNKAFK